MSPAVPTLENAFAGRGKMNERINAAGISRRAKDNMTPSRLKKSAIKGRLPRKGIAERATADANP